LARAISVAESQRDQVNVFVIESWVGSPLRYALTSTAPGKFAVIHVKDLSEVQGNHFWFAYRDTTWNQAESPESLLQRRGCLAGEAVTKLLPDQRIMALPVNCR
jgi:hypothetical protein